MNTTETPVERRQRETLERCTTAAQRARVEQAYADGKSAYAMNRTGKAVVSEAKRWFETGDIEKFGNGLYDFSTQALNEIAHYNLLGFRAVYPHPALWIENLLLRDARSIENVERHSLVVYRDGLTYGDVLTEILRLAAEHRGRLVVEFNAEARAEKLREASRLADELGFKLVKTTDN